MKLFYLQRSRYDENFVGIAAESAAGALQVLGLWAADIDLVEEQAGFSIGGKPRVVWPIPKIESPRKIAR